MKPVHIVSRKSPLALRQSEIVAAALRSARPGLNVEITGISTSGDRREAGFAGKSDFTRELEQMLLAGDADLAVHSMKDVAARLPGGLEIGAMLERDNPFDVLLLNKDKGIDFDSLPGSATVGTSSLRRRCQLQHLRPDLRVLELHGNIGTRIQKLDAGKYDAIVLAAAGLRRMGLESRITEFLHEKMIPAIGQGAIGIENKKDCDPELRQLLREVSHEETELRVRTERLTGELLGADCKSPVAVHAALDENGLLLRAMAGDNEGAYISAHACDKTGGEQWRILAEKVVYSMKQQGVEQILEKARQ